MTIENQEPLGKFPNWEGIMSFTKGLTLTRPWYHIIDRSEMGCYLRYEKVLTTHARHELFPGYQFGVEVCKLNKEFLRKREYAIELSCREEIPASKDGQKLWLISTPPIASDSTQDRKLRDFYESLREEAIDADCESLAIKDIRRILGMRK